MNDCYSSFCFNLFPFMRTPKLTLSSYDLLETKIVVTEEILVVDICN